MPTVTNEDYYDVPLGPLKNWQLPLGVLVISVGRSGYASVVFTSVEKVTNKDQLPWHVTPSSAEGLIPPVLNALREFRNIQTDHLNSFVDFEKALAEYIPVRDWTIGSAHDPSTTIGAEWERIARSETLYKLANAGYTAFNNIFPQESQLRKWIDQLRPGALIDIHWIDGVSNFPWGLLYLRPPKYGEKVDANYFWGLRFRTDWQSHRAKNVHHALGKIDDSFLGHAYYWCGPKEDDAFQEAMWQKNRWSALSTHVAVPREIEGAKEELLTWLESPTPTPMPVVYIFCKAQTDRNTSVLEFGDSAYGSESVKIEETILPATNFDGAPFVFFNACGSAKFVAGSSLNRLETRFFDRGCAAYLGTVHETPIIMASKFAAVFFHFFYGNFQNTVVSAGEAATQARRFMWLTYRNIGGLFYTYVNEYDLCMTDLEGYNQLRGEVGR
jgi:hypothetical protein